VHGEKVRARFGMAMPQLERAREGAERRLESGQRAAWAAASHWASTTAARGLWWRGSRGGLDFCTLVGTSVRWVASGFEREEW
jgi:hypothetical protein